MSLAIAHDRVIGISLGDALGPVFGGGRAPRFKESTWYVLFNVGTTAGVVTIEVAADSTDAGLWSSVGTITWAAASRWDHLSLTGVHLAIRARISTAIVGGTVDIHAIGRE